jgi:trans-L-3-hydroxyproline dehydratase
MELTTLDYHTAGEPLRIVTSGLPDVRGESMLAKRRFMQENLDHYRRFLMLEPRGHADMYGAVLTEPVTSDGNVGVLFLHNQGYSTMCGHGIIALVTAGIEQSLFDIPDPERVCIDTPAGRITARANLGLDGKTESVSFLNVPSFVLLPDCKLEMEGRAVDASIAFGGAFYAYVDAGLFGLELVPSEVSRIIRLGREIKRLCNRQYAIRHPVGDADLNFLYGTIFVKPLGQVNRSRNVCVFADGELDRSPTGTGVSGRAAIHYARGELGLNETLEIESIIGTGFRVRCVEETTQGQYAAVVTEVTGSAHICGKQYFTLDERDSLREGFLLR